MGAKCGSNVLCLVGIDMNAAGVSEGNRLLGGVKGEGCISQRPEVDGIGVLGMLLTIIDRFPCSI